MKITKSKFRQIVKEELAKIIVELDWPEVPEPIAPAGAGLDEEISDDEGTFASRHGSGKSASSGLVVNPSFKLDKPPTPAVATTPAEPKKKFGHRIKALGRKLGIGGKDEPVEAPVQSKAGMGRGKTIFGKPITKAEPPEPLAAMPTQIVGKPEDTEGFGERHGSGKSAVETGESTDSKKWTGGPEESTDAANVYSRVFKGQAGDPYTYRETSPGVFQAKKAGAKSWRTVPKSSKGYKSVQNLAKTGKSLWKPEVVPPKKDPPKEEGKLDSDGQPSATVTTKESKESVDPLITETLARWQELIK